MEIKFNILQVAKCFAAEQREKDEQARIKLEENNSKYIHEVENVKTTILAAVQKLHGVPTLRGHIDVFVEDKKNTLCLIYIGNEKFCRINVECRIRPNMTNQYFGILYSTTFWAPDSKCDVNCVIPRWYSISHQESCKVQDYVYHSMGDVPNSLDVLAYHLSKWL